MISGAPQRFKGAPVIIAPPTTVFAATTCGSAHQLVRHREPLQGEMGVHLVERSTHGCKEFRESTRCDYDRPFIPWPLGENTPDDTVYQLGISQHDTRLDAVLGIGADGLRRWTELGHGKLG